LAGEARGHAAARHATTTRRHGSTGAGGAHVTRLGAVHLRVHTGATVGTDVRGLVKDGTVVCGICAGTWSI